MSDRSRLSFALANSVQCYLGRGILSVLIDMVYTVKTRMLL